MVIDHETGPTIKTKTPKQAEPSQSLIRVKVRSHTHKRTHMHTHTPTHTHTAETLLIGLCEHHCYERADVL